jgi:hypothetical protein
MKKGMRKCVKCGDYGKWKYKKGAKHFCTAKHKKEYYENHIPTLIKEIQKEFNAMVTEDQPCAKCGNMYTYTDKDGNEKSSMQCSHVWSIGSTPGLRFDIFNVLPMCGRDHNFWWHLEPMEARPWFKDKYPKRYEYLEFARHQTKKWTATELKEIRKAIKEKNRKKLLRFKDEYTNS